MTMRLRIVMPVLNEAGKDCRDAFADGGNLRAALSALQTLRQQGAELVVVDGGSTDNTWALARLLADQVLLAPRGRAVQMNAGARREHPPGCERGSQKDKAATVFLFLHSDTRLPTNALGFIQAALDSGAVWGRFDVRFDSAHPVLRVVAQLMSLRSRLTGIATGDQAIFVARHAFEKIGGFANLPLMEDIDLCARLKKLSPPACLRPRVTTSARRWLQNGMWRTIFLMWQLRLAYFLGADPQHLASRYGYTRPFAPAFAAIAIMAKAPVAGVCKTRLIPLLGARGAARAQRRFTLNTLQLARESALGNVTIHCTPDPQHPFFRAVQRVYGASCEVQPQGDLGDRMQAAFTHHFARNPGLPLLLVGTDCPALSPGHLQQAALALAQCDVVLIPAEDGGYVLIGMRRQVPMAFQNITWSTSEVITQTRAQLKRAGATWQELPALWDVDEPADWQRLQHLETRA